MKSHFRRNIFSCIILITFFSICNVKAALTLTFHTGAETYKLTGSDTGTPSNFGGGYTAWNLTGIGGTGDTTTTTLNDDSIFSTSTGTPGNPAFSFDIELQIGNSLGGLMSFAMGTSSALAQTFTGTGATGSYAAHNTGNKTRISGLNGQTMTLITGTSFSSISIVVVPEPYEISIAFGLILLFFSLWRKTNRIVKVRNTNESRKVP
ncbi:hypothetical protein OAM01_01345 [bacterium]|nr:hypothetical protein [bacterium]